MASSRNSPSTNKARDKTRLSPGLARQATAAAGRQPNAGSEGKQEGALQVTRGGEGML